MQIINLGYWQPVCDAGPWGNFAKMVTSAAGSAGDKAIISALEEGEDIGSNTYEWKLRDMKGENRNLIRDELWPKQKATHKLISKLAKQALGGAWPPTPETHLEAQFLISTNKNIEFLLFGYNVL